MVPSRLFVMRRQSAPKAGGAEGASAEGGQRSRPCQVRPIADCASAVRQLVELDDGLLQVRGHRLRGRDGDEIRRRSYGMVGREAAPGENPHAVFRHHGVAARAASGPRRSTPGRSWWGGGPNAGAADARHGPPSWARVGPSAAAPVRPRWRWVARPAAGAGADDPPPRADDRKPKKPPSSARLPAGTLPSMTAAGSTRVARRRFAAPRPISRPSHEAPHARPAFEPVSAPSRRIRRDRPAERAASPASERRVMSAKP